jgi:hypothetical protein
MGDKFKDICVCEQGSLGMEPSWKMWKKKGEEANKVWTTQLYLLASNRRGYLLFLCDETLSL